MSGQLTKFNAAVKREVFNKSKKFQNADQIKNGLAWYGPHNDLPEKLLKLRDDSVWHDIALRGKIKYFQGDGLALDNQTELPEFINDRGDSPNDLLEQVATNWALFNGFACIIIWDKGSVAGLNAPKISQIIPVGFDKIRAQEADETNTIRHWYYANKWDNKMRSDFENRAEKIPVFNPRLVEATSENEGGQPKQIFVFKEYNPSSNYYPDPSYKGALQSILTHSIVQKFKLAHLNNAIMSSLHVKLVGQFSPEQAMELTRDLDNQMAGALNAGNHIVTQAPEAGLGVTFESIGAGGQANIYDSYAEVAQQEILSGHGIIFKEAVGLEEESKGLSAEQIQEKFTVFINVTIRKNQQKILSGLNKIWKYFSEVDAKLEINKTDLLEGLEPLDQMDDNITDEETDTTLGIG